MSYIDLTSEVEQMKELEEKFDLELGAISAFLNEEPDISDEYMLFIRGEVKSKSGSPLTDAVEIKIAAYDNQGRVVGADKTIIDEETFSGFDTFEVILSLVVSDIVKIRIFPTVLG